MKNRLFLGLGTVISVLVLSQVSALAADSESGTETLGATLPLTWCYAPYRRWVVGKTQTVGCCRLVSFIFNSICHIPWLWYDGRTIARGNDRWLSHLHCIAFCPVLCGRQYISWRRPGGNTETQCSASTDRYSAVKLDRYYRCKYADDQTYHKGK